MASDLDSHGQPLARAFCARMVTERQIDELIGLCKGILADGIVVAEEVNFIASWLDQNRAATNRWPGNVLYDRIRRVLADGAVDAEEEAELVSVLLDTTGGPVSDSDAGSMSTALPLDVPPPTVVFNGSHFCLTGKFAFGTRRECESEIVNRGGLIHASPRRDTGFVVIGSVGSRDWIHSTHGRKIERAVELRSEGHGVSLIGEEHWIESLSR